VLLPPAFEEGALVGAEMTRRVEELPVEKPRTVDTLEPVREGVAVEVGNPVAVLVVVASAKTMMVTSGMQVVALCVTVRV